MAKVLLFRDSFLYFVAKSVRKNKVGWFGAVLCIQNLPKRYCLAKITNKYSIIDMNLTFLYNTIVEQRVEEGRNIFSDRLYNLR